MVQYMYLIIVLLGDDLLYRKQEDVKSGSAREPSSWIEMKQVCTYQSKATNMSNMGDAACLPSRLIVVIGL